MRKCKICERKYYGKGYCQRHYCQFRQFGFIKRTRFDKNEINCANSICTMFLYNKNGEKIATTIFNEEYLEEVKKYKWHLTYFGYVATDIKEKVLRLHNVVLPVKKGFVIDHINHDTTNNLKLNLRYATNQQNMRNRKSKGVYFENQTKKWRPTITINKKKLYFKRYDDFDEALRVRNEAVKKYFGEFSCSLN